MAKAKLYLFSWSATNARHYIEARNEESARKKFYKMIGESLGRYFKCTLVVG